jgi:hypothetical protein
VTLRRDAVTVPVGSGWQLCFQKQYQEFWKAADGRGSYSRAMVPDIVVAGGGDESSGPGRLIVLDAKYRVNDGLGDALSSIHTYRDALVREPEAGRIAGIVSAAYLVAPVLPDVRSSYRDTGMPGRLFHPEYRRSFRFGAVTLRPGMTVADVAAVLQSVVDDALAA